jgi:hypothetical protein
MLLNESHYRIWKWEIMLKFNEHPTEQWEIMLKFNEHPTEQSRASVIEAEYYSIGRPGSVVERQS